MLVRIHFDDLEIPVNLPYNLFTDDQGLEDLLDLLHEKLTTEQERRLGLELSIETIEVEQEGNGLYAILYFKNQTSEKIALRNG